ncbi:MAG: acyl carrier protein [Clostridia bacterium]|nr:acyl carrier protein [Clostridia bacterium]
MVFEKLRAALAAQLGIAEEEIKPESRLVEDLMADSLDIVELIMDLEAEYGVQIPDDDLPKIRTVGDIVRYIEK